MNATTLQRGHHRAHLRQRAAVLLEVVLALLLFVAATAIISGGLSTSTNAVDRLRLQTHASNLAASILAEVQLGLHPMATTGPAPFDPPFQDWTWELALTPSTSFSTEATRFPLQKVEVVVRNANEPVLFRMAQIIALDSVLTPGEPAEASQPATTSNSTAPVPQPTSSPEVGLP